MWISALNRALLAAAFGGNALAAGDASFEPCTEGGFSTSEARASQAGQAGKGLSRTHFVPPVPYRLPVRGPCIDGDVAPMGTVPGILAHEELAVVRSSPIEAMKARFRPPH